jgi:hypothetical protein
LVGRTTVQFPVTAIGRGLETLNAGINPGTRLGGLVGQNGYWWWKKIKNNLGLQISINSNTDKLYDKKITNLSLRFESKVEEAISNKVFPNRLSQFDLSNPIR